MASYKEVKQQMGRDFLLHLNHPQQLRTIHSGGSIPPQVRKMRSAYQCRTPNECFALEDHNGRSNLRPDLLRLKTPQPGFCEDHAVRAELFSSSQVSPVDKKRVSKAKALLGKPENQRAVCDCAHDIEAHLNIRVCGDQYYLYMPPIWKIATADDVVRAIRADYPGGEELIGCLSTQSRNQLLHLLKTSNRLIISPEDFDCSARILNFSDCAMDVVTGRLLEQLPEHYATTFINVSRYDLEHPRCIGALDKIIQNALDGDPSKEQLLLEILGVIISNDLPKNFFLFVGDSNTGKSKLGEFLVELIGRNCSLNLDKGPTSLCNRFTLGNFPGKKLAFCYELPDQPIDVQTVAQLKQLTGDGALLSGEKKHMSAFSFRNTAKLLFCSNHPLVLSKDDQALWNRVVLLPFENPIPVEKQDHQLLAKLEIEKGWIVLRALEAYRQLVQKNFQFTEVTVPAEYIPQIRSPYLETIRNFVHCNCSLRADARTRVEELYNAFADYCTDLNLELCGRSTFSAFLGQVAPIRHLKMNGGNKRGIEGLELKLQSPEVSNVSAG